MPASLRCCFAASPQWTIRRLTPASCLATPVVRRQAVVEHQHSWDPAEYEFDPYNLTAVHVSEAASPNKADGCSAGAAPAQDAAAAAAEAPPVKRRPGRQRRTSVLCQVSSTSR